MSNVKKEKEGKPSSKNKEDKKPQIGDSKPAPVSEDKKVSSDNKQQKNQKRERKRKNTRSSGSAKRELLTVSGGTLQ